MEIDTFCDKCCVNHRTALPEALAEIRRLREVEIAARSLLQHIETIPYRDIANLRLGFAVPAYENLAALVTTPTPEAS